MDKLTPEDAENVCFIMQRAINESRFMKLEQPLASKETLDWHKRHANYLEEVLGRLTQLMNKDLDPEHVFVLH